MVAATKTSAPLQQGGRQDQAAKNTADRSALAEIRSSLEILLGAGVHELRVPKAGRARTVSGYYDSIDALARDAHRWDGRAPGVYVTLNPCVPALLARSANRARENAESTTADRDIARRMRLFIDLDPVRPSGIASTDAEHLAALDRARAIRSDLRALGWPEPILMDSGNGAALFYAIDLPNDAEANTVVSGLLRGLASRFSDDVVAIDATVSNAARIVRIPGTLNAKGDDTAERPHRRCRIIDAPDVLETVDVDELRAVAAWAPVEPARSASRANGSAFDIDSFIGAHGFEIQSDGDWDGKRRIKLARCPFDAEHTGGSAALFVFPSGAVSFRCLHNGCAGRDWRAVRELFEPERKPRQQHDDGERIHARDVSDDIAPVSTATPWPDPIGEAAYIGPLGGFVRMIEPHTEADPNAILVQSLAAFGSVAGAERYYRVEEDKHPPRLFGAVVGDTGKGRKGVSWGRTRKLLNTVDETWQTASGLSSGEGIIWAVRDAIKERKRVKSGEYEDVETDPGVNDKRLLVVESELASVLKVLSREGNTLSPIIRDAWDRGALRSMTKNSPARSTGAHISIVGHITSTELRRELDATDIANGFANRFLFVAAKRSKELPFGGRAESLDVGPIVRRLKDAVAIAREPAEITMDPEARERWASIYSDLSAGRPGLLGAVTGRAEAQVIRLAVVYAIAGGDDVIRLPHLDAGLAVWRYCADSAAWIFGESLGDRIADTAMAAIREAGNEGVSRTDLRDLLGKGYGDRLTRALATLESAGLAHPRRVDTGGRPAERWYPGRADREPAPIPKAPKAPKGGGDAGPAGPLGASGASGASGVRERPDEHEPPPPDDTLAPAGPDAPIADGWGYEA